MVEGKDWDDDVIEEIFGAFCADILRERARLGGDWVVCGVLPSRRIRDLVRWIIVGRYLQ